MEEEATKKKERSSELRFLSPTEVALSRTPGGFLSMKVGDQESHARVNLHRCFPFSADRQHISARDAEGEEIGVFRGLEGFAPEAVALIEEELERRYFTPIIEKIVSLKEEFGYTYWEVLSDAGPCRFTVQAGASNVVTLEARRLLIIDVDGNRFELPDYGTLDAKSLKIVEMLL